MTKEERIAGFSKLSQYIRQIDATQKDELVSKAANTNPWFTPQNVGQALNGIVHFLTPASMSEWLNNYDLTVSICSLNF